MTKVVHAEWEQGDYLDWGDTCSNCWYDSGIEPCHLEKCPNCGAIMDGKRNNKKETMKEKLIKLLNEGHFCWQMGSGYDTWEECVADHLLDNDVIVQDSTLVEIDQPREQILATERCRKGKRH